MSEWSATMPVLALVSTLVALVLVIALWARRGAPWPCGGAEQAGAPRATGALRRR